MPDFHYVYTLESLGDCEHFYVGLTDDLATRLCKVVTATQVIRQLEKLPARERRKVFAYVDGAIERREEAEDRRAIAEVRRDPRPPVPWKAVKARIGLA